VAIAAKNRQSRAFSVIVGVMAADALIMEGVPQRSIWMVTGGTVYVTVARFEFGFIQNILAILIPVMTGQAFIALHVHLVEIIEEIHRRPLSFGEGRGVVFHINSGDTFDIDQD
jgi:hypothetical protein